MKLDEFDLVRDVLDHEIVDSVGLPCGMVDDVELVRDADRGSMRVSALLVGRGYAQRRLPPTLARVARWIFGNAKTRVPWSAVASVGERITLRARAASLRLGAADRRMARWVRKWPGA